MAPSTAQKSLHYSHKPSPDVSPQLSSRFPIARWAPIPLRLIVGYGFMAHGFAKLARGPEAFPAILLLIGSCPPESPRLDDPGVDAKSVGPLVQAQPARFAQPCPTILQTIGTPDGGDPVSAVRGIDRATPVTAGRAGSVRRLGFACPRSEHVDDAESGLSRRRAAALREGLPARRSPRGPRAGRPRA